MTVCPACLQELVDSQPSVLAKYGRDLTHLAREGKLDPLVGRNDEIRRCGLGCYQHVYINIYSVHALSAPQQLMHMVHLIHS